MKTQIFDIEIAKQYGINEAIILNLLDFWIDKNKANEKNFYDGNYWTYNSIKSWGKLMPYLSERKIANALEHLEKEELIIVGNYNTSNYDRTKWYAITKKGYSILQNCEIDLTKTQSPFDKIAEPIPVYITSIYKEKDKEIYKEKEKEKIDYDYIIECYHKACPRLQKVKLLSDKRKAILRARIKSYGLDLLLQLFSIAGKSDFLCGVNSKSWKATFDWILNDTNIAKILDGNYNNKQSVQLKNNGGYKVL